MGKKKFETEIIKGSYEKQKFNLEKKSKSNLEMKEKLGEKTEKEKRWFCFIDTLPRHWRTRRPDSSFSVLHKLPGL